MGYSEYGNVLKITHYVVKAYLENIDGNSDRITTKAEILYFLNA